MKMSEMPQIFPFNSLLKGFSYMKDFQVNLILIYWPLCIAISVQVMGLVNGYISQLLG